MKKLLFFCTLLLCFYTSKAQQEFVIDTTLTGSFCQTPQISNHLDQLEQIRNHNNYSTVYVKIYIHVLRQEQEPYGGQTVEGVNRIVKNLYDAFDPTGIYFSWDGHINYIYNDEYYYPSMSDADSLIDEYNHTNGIDIYLVDDTSSRVAYSHGVGMFTGLVLGGMLGASINGKLGGFSTLARSKYIAHLMGHVLFLYHTHHGSIPGDGGCPELVDGSNGLTCGDYMSDTPADPGLFTYPEGINVNNSCVYTPMYYDPNPPLDDNLDEYHPDTTNYMSSTLVSCMNQFTINQIKHMKGAILFLEQLQPVQLQDYTYIRPEEDCYVCTNKIFTVYSNASIADLEIFTSSNISASIIGTTNNSMTVNITSLIGDDEGSQGYFQIVDTGGGSGQLVLAKQPIWVGLPQTPADGLLYGTGDDDMPIDQGDPAGHVLGGLDYRFGGFDYNGWDYPEPRIEVAGGTSSNDQVWQFYEYNKFFNIASSMSGGDTGWVRAYGINPCGDGFYSDNEICVKNYGDGAPECDPEPLPIIYYPNPASSILEIDLSLQEYKTFNVVIYDETQTVRHSEDSTNIVKTIDVMSLENGTYYLHVYDGNELILSKILIINH